MRRQRLVGLGIVSFLLLALTLICASASWFIQDRKSQEASQGLGSDAVADTSPYFVANNNVYRGTDAGDEVTLTLSTEGQTLFGATTEDFLITWVGGRYLDGEDASGNPILGNAIVGDQTPTHKGTVAGEHYYQIVEKATGQIICNKHVVSIAQDTLQLTSYNASPSLPGQTTSYTVTWTGVHSGETYTTTATTAPVPWTAWDSFSVGNATTDDYQAATAVTLASYKSAIETLFKANHNIASAPSTNIVCKVVATAYAVSDSGTTYYGTLEQALDKTVGAPSATTVIPMLSASAKDKAGTTTYSFAVSVTNKESATTFVHKLTKDVFVGTNVTLRVLYDTTNISVIRNLVKVSGSPTLELTRRNNTTYLKNEVVVMPGVILTNNGRVEIAGEISGGNGGKIVNSMVFGNHAQIEMGKNAQLVCDKAEGAKAGGDLTCYGYITEATKDNGSKVIAKSGTTTVVFSISEHRGGTKFSGTYANMKGSPFNRFWMETISSELTVKSSAKLYGFTDLFADDKDNTTTIALVGNNDNYLINLKSGSYLVAKYNHEGDGKVSSTNRTTRLQIYGDASVNSLSLSLTASVVGTVNLSTAQVLFPISGYFNISLHPLTEAGKADIALNNDIKLLPGASLTIAKGVTVTGGQLVVYDSMHGVENSDTAGTTYQWGADTPAKLTVNGTLEMEKLGGFVTADSAGGIVNVTSSASVVTNELISAGFMTSDWDDKTYTLTLKQYDMTTQEVAATATSGLTAGKYYSIAGKNNTGIGHVDDSAEFDIFYNFVNADGTAIDASTVTNTNPTVYKLSDTARNLVGATLNGSAFAGWFTDAECSPENQISKLDSDIIFAEFGGDATLYGKFAPTAYTVTFDPGTNASSNVNVTVNPIPVAGGSSFNPYTNLEIDSIVSGYENDVLKDRFFEGWYDSEGNRVNGAITVNSNITLTAHWTTKHKVTFNMESSGITVPGSASNIIYVVPGNVFNPYAFFNHADYDENINFSQMFVGWYLDSAFTTPYEPSEEGLNADISYYSDWTNKMSITLDHTTGNTDPTFVLTVGSNSTAAGSEGTFYARPSDIVKFDPGNAKSWDATNDTIKTALVSSEGYTMEENFSISVTTETSICIIEGTMITLADGSKKPVEELTKDDSLLIFNHFTGELEPGTIAMLDHLEMIRQWTRIINLEFSNGEILRIAWSHGVFDSTLNKYVFINETNYLDFIDHEFYATEFDGSVFVEQHVTLVNAYITEEYVKVYNPTTVLHLNYFANGILNVTANPDPNAISGHVNYFELDENMKYDEEKMQADIEKYGLYTYEDFKDYLTEEQFAALPWNYFKVAVGKGLITWETLIYVAEYINNATLIP